MIKAVPQKCGETLTVKYGEKIYNSASTLCEDGMIFCFVTDEGIREDVVIPFEDLKKLTETQGE